MPPTTQPPTSELRPRNSTLPAPSASRGLWSVVRGPFLLPLALFSVLWLDLIRQLSYAWSTNEQYAYGYFVPILALGLFLKKWPTRPITTDHRPPTTVPWTAGRGQWSVVSSLVVLAALALLPLRVIHEINQDWPLITWPYTAIVVALTLYAVHLAGQEVGSTEQGAQSGEQRSEVSSRWSVVSGPLSIFRSPWLLHFAFPICFILLAVTWPYRIEHNLTQGLQRAVTAVTVEALGWLNVPAVQRGNLIELSTGVVGVDEACSGIRSFQSTLMAALFLGELYLFRWPVRLLFVVTGLSLALALNVGRAFFLAWQASSTGLSAVDKWHDPAGFTIVIICFVFLWLLSWLLRTRKTSALQPPALNSQLSTLNSQISAPTPPPSHSPVVPGSVVGSPVVSSPWSVVSSPRAFVLALGLWSLFLIVFTEAWYRSSPANNTQSAAWWVSYPTNAPGFAEVPVSAAARKLLKYDEGATASWTEPDGTQWTAFCFRWRAGDPTARMSALGHRPEYCMTGSGHQMNAELGTKYLPVHGLNLPFRAYIFDAPQRPLYVFFCLWEEGGTAKQTGFDKTKYHSRLRSVLERRRGLGQQTLEIICTGYPDMEQAQAAVTVRLPELIRIESTSSPRSSNFATRTSLK